MSDTSHGLLSIEWLLMEDSPDSEISKMQVLGFLLCPLSPRSLATCHRHHSLVLFLTLFGLEVDVRKGGTPVKKNIWRHSAISPEITKTNTSALCNVANDITSSKRVLANNPVSLNDRSGGISSVGRARA